MLVDKHALEVQEELRKIKEIPENSIISSYAQLQGGADTTIFEINFQNHSRKYVQRIFRSGASNKNAEFEYNIQTTLFENNISVPKTYLLKLTPNTRERSYFIMDKIEGIRADLLPIEKPEQYEQLVEKLLQELYRIHKLNPKLFPQLHLPDIQENPYAILDKSLSGRKSYLEKYPEELKEWKLVIDWLDSNKKHHPFKELVVIHGDFHPLNVMSQDDEKLVILDWTNIKISDIREELGFTATALSVGSEENVVPMIISKYEKISGTKIENLSYFMILANAYNLLRFYSMIHNPSITNETEDTKNFFKAMKVYPLFLVQLIKDTCNIELKEIRDFFNDED